MLKKKKKDPGHQEQELCTQLGAASLTPYTPVLSQCTCYPLFLLLETVPREPSWHLPPSQLLAPWCWVTQQSLTLW